MRSWERWLEKESYEDPAGGSWARHAWGHSSLSSDDRSTHAKPGAVEPHCMPNQAASLPASKQLCPQQIVRLQGEQERIISRCQDEIAHWQKVGETITPSKSDSEPSPIDSLTRSWCQLGLLPSYQEGLWIPTKSLFSSGTTGFVQCSAKQAAGLAEHRKECVRKALDDFTKTRRNSKSKVAFTADLQGWNSGAGDLVDVRGHVQNKTELKRKPWIAQKPHSKPKSLGSENDVKSKDLNPGDGHFVLGHPVMGTLTDIYGIFVNPANEEHGAQNSS
ncbi:hypothetical protein P7K49_002569 [Saguinus oedipus]|uniref:Uncharacterized protein n=1 Tax=Saguinus oedipus TaxID=9490 RepID=A0ABQ9WHP5_SAGOE|nr:hypothetical protein P7K49_002569 [Saguinus oedipus]